MIAYRRRDALLDALSRTGSLTVRHAADQLGVSEVTIRNDLALLEQQGCLRRVHGGAVRVVRADMTAFPGATPAGTVVASRAATMVEDGEAIVIAAGRMGEQLARALAGRTNLSVITNSLEVASILAQERSNTVIIAGGVVQASGAVYIDALTNQGLGHLRSVRAFVPAAHLTPSAGLLADSLEQ
ncbi:MAG TPA: DeoR/GlpR family DNA-binding transcription regulator, partial [Chloroflexota bacterium]|nr:DeoR/GlpR family DNA-binding transcription regulator [Chloroflexota bacterium]